MKFRGTNAVCSACAAGVSVVCMSSMATALAAVGAAAGASGAGMAGMGSTGGAAEAPSSMTGSSFLSVLFERLGFGALSRIPNEILQPLLVVLLTVATATAFLAYCGHGRPHALLLTAVSAAAMYSSIYIWMSDPIYLLSLGGLLGAGLWGIYLAAHSRQIRPAD